MERDDMDCPHESGHDLAEAYVAGTLSEAEQDAFEQHFFACSACLGRVQMLQEIKEEAARLDRSLSWVVQRAWKIARVEIKKLPSVNDVNEDDDEAEP